MGGLLLLLPLVSARADPVPAAGEASQHHRFETFSGIAVTYDSGFAYAGGVWALGRPVEDTGFRLRLLGGGGSYAYDGSRSGPAGPIPTRFHGDVALWEGMAGYLIRRGEWIVKTYAGVVYIDHALTPQDPSNSVQGSQWGIKALAEIWRNIGTHGLFSLDSSIASAFGDYRVHARLGSKVKNRVSLGGEGGAGGNEDYNAVRGGGFLRWHGASGDFTLAGGATGDYFDGDMTPYLTFDYYRKF
ncbi:MAG: cellulose biosynthesis protein BcsS [Pseudomonadota bacterium]|nr:cellulose biosynthesis protein BcsS [Pseudomonadota bacterium]